MPAGSPRVPASCSRAFGAWRGQLPDDAGFLTTLTSLPFEICLPKGCVCMSVVGVPIFSWFFPLSFTGRGEGEAKQPERTTRHNILHSGAARPRQSSLCSMLDPVGRETHTSEVLGLEIKVGTK